MSWVRPRKGIDRTDAFEREVQRAIAIKVPASWHKRLGEGAEAMGYGNVTELLRALIHRFVHEFDSFDHDGTREFLVKGTEVSVSALLLHMATGPISTKKIGVPPERASKALQKLSETLRIG